jgi:hypothetical protein
MSDVENCNWKETLEDWRWDGVDLKDILLRLEVISVHFMGMSRDWAATVPADYRRCAYVITSSNPFNSLEEIREYVEILAVDQAGQALVGRSILNTYLDATYGETFQVLPLAEAKSVVDEVRRTQKAQAEQVAFEVDVALSP